MFSDTATEEKQNDEPQQMTYDEWKKSQEESRTKPQFNLRKVEGTKKGMKIVKKPTEEDNEADGSLFFPKKVTKLCHSSRTIAPRITYLYFFQKAGTFN